MEKELKFERKEQHQDLPECSFYERGLYLSIQNGSQWECFRKDYCKNFCDRCVERVTYK